MFKFLGNAENNVENTEDAENKNTEKRQDCKSTT